MSALVVFEHRATGRRPARRTRGFALAAGVLAMAAVLGAQPAARVASLFDEFTWRAVGPAVMGGRTVDFAAPPEAPGTIYAAIGPAGVWKSENHGVTWRPVFHREAASSVGAVAVAPGRPETIWAGTGEATCRNSVTLGDGVYRSIDGGKTWENRGLRDTRHISRILIDPADPDTVLVAAMGHLWGPNVERGLFRSTDGGSTWAKTLYVDENTGIAALVRDAGNPDLLYAAAYDHRRLPWSFRSGGPGSGLYRSTDRGTTWRKLEQGLPGGDLGRIGLATAPGTPGVVYALVEAAESGLFRSEDGGETWTRTAGPDVFKRVNTRPFYYSHIFVDPTDDRKVYVLSTGLFVSEDGGRKFRPIGAGTHPDHHALWIDPANPRHLVDGNDGGIDISYDGGQNWLPVQSIDAAQVYQVGFDYSRPYRVTCGLQDNGSWSGPSSSRDPRGILNEDWVSVGGGDGFFVKTSPTDANIVYANSQMNGLMRYDFRRGLAKAVRPLTPLSEPPYRYNWNSPILISPHDPETVYCGAQVLLRTRDGGRTWTVASPDLTTADPAKMGEGTGPFYVENSGAEMHCTITTIAEAPAAGGVLWCGTDDGRLHVSRDGGVNWRDVTRNVPGLPVGTWCSRVEASHFAAGTAYAAFDGHRTDDYTAYLYRTDDFGSTWTSISSGLTFGWVHVVREDPRNHNLLYVGTEFGVFASLDRGATWFSLKLNLPTVAVHDIAVHPRERDLIVGTHGRGIWILDDISFIQNLTEEILTSDLHLFSMRPVDPARSGNRGESFSKPVFQAKNPPYGAMFTTWVREPLKDKLRLRVADSVGRILYQTELAQSAGFHRQVWSLEFIPESKDGRRHTPAMTGNLGLPQVPPGTYTASLDRGVGTVTRAFEILADDRAVFSEADRTAQAEALAELLRVSRSSGLAVTAVRSVRRHLTDLGKALAASPAAVAEFEVRFAPIEADLTPGDLLYYLSDRTTALRGGSPAQLLTTLGVSVAGYPEAPTAAEARLIADLAARIDSGIDRLNALLRTLPQLDATLKAAGLQPFPTLREIEH